MNYQQLLNSLHGVRPCGSGHMARCPAHDDHNPSLSICERNGRLLIKCHAGCTIDKVVDAIGISKSELFVDNMNKAEPKPAPEPASSHRSVPAPVAAVDIQRMHQQLSQKARDYLRRERLISSEVIDRYLLGVVKNTGSERISIPIADSTASIVDVRCWLPPEHRSENAAKMIHWAKGYGAPRLFPINQLNQDDLVLVEGELDALALISQGIAAITITAGATTWPEALSEHFADKRVTILMDNDGAGENGAQQRAMSLVTCSSTVHVATWPAQRKKGWDVTDELKEHGVHSVKCLLRKAKPFKRENDWVCDDEPPLLSFPIDALATPLRHLCAEGAKAIQCPAEYLAVPSLVLAGAAIGRARFLHLKRGWEEYGALYAAIVADPGSAKSPALTQAAVPLTKRALELHKAYKLRLAQYEQDILHWQKRPDQNDKPEKPSLERVFVSDITAESLAQVLEENPRGLALFRDELSGWAQSMNAYKGGKGGDRQFFLSLWSGTPSPVDRKSQDRPLYLSHPFLAVVGTIQPDLVQALLHESRWDDGLLDRFLFAYPNVHIPDAWSDAEIAAETHHAVDALFTRLYELEEDEQYTKVIMNEAARALWVEWYAHNQQELKHAPKPLQGVWSKMPSQCSRLILITHLTRWAAGEAFDSQCVDKRSVINGTLLAEYFKSHARRIYGVIDESSEERRRRKAVDWLQRKGNAGVKARDIQRAKIDGIKKAKEAQDLLEELVSMGRGEWEDGQFYLKDQSTLDKAAHLAVKQ